DSRVAGMREVLAPEVETLWFSQRESLPEWVGQSDAVVRGTGVSTDSSGHPTFTLNLPGEEPQDVRLALIGEHHVGNALAAAAIAHACGAGTKPVADGAHRLALGRDRAQRRLQREPRIHAGLPEDPGLDGPRGRGEPSAPDLRRARRDARTR